MWRKYKNNSLKWFVYRRWGLRCYHLRAPSSDVVLSSAFCHSENWQCGIKLACLSSLSRTCFWSMFSVSETRYICFRCSCAIQLCRKINSSKTKIPIAEVSFTFKQLSIVLTSMTQRKRKQTSDKTFTPNEQHRGDIGCYSSSQACVSLQRFHCHLGDC